MVTVAVAFAASQLLQAALLRLGIATPLRAPLAWAVLASLTVVSLAQVGGLVTLAFHGAHRRRDMIASLVFGAIAFMLVVAQAPPGVAAVFGYFALARMRWRDDVGAATLGLVILIGLGASLWSVLTRSLPIAGMPRPVSAIMTMVEWSRWLIVLYFFAALPGALLRIGVSIRNVSRRLTLSHVLTGVVPLLLIGALWFVATYLGIGAERATTAARLIDDEGDRLAAELSRAARAAEGPAQALGGIARADTSRWPGLRLWVLDRTLERVSGDSIPGEARLAAWPDSLAGRRVVSIGDSTYLAARGAADTARAARPALIALVPIREVFASVESTVRVPLSIDPRTSITAGGGSLVVGTGQPGNPAPRRGITRSNTRELRRMADSIALAERQRPARASARAGRPFAGHSMLNGLQATPDAWHSRNFLLNADVPFAETVAGLFRNARENPYNLIVLGVLALLTAVFLVVAVFNVGMVAAMSRSITRAIGALRAGAEQLRAGNLTHRIPVEGSDDLWSVAEAFNQMAVGLERSRELEKERERLESELALARQIQARLLPSGPPAIAGLEIAGASESARQVGGDYYDHIPLGDGRVLLVIADVSGKGVPAALIMSGFRAALMSQDVGRESVPALAARMNHFLYRSVETGRFVTAFVAMLDGGTGRLAYTNAGHNPPLVVRRDGQVERLTEGGLLFGFLPDAEFAGGETVLAPGDVAVLFTDGVTEAANATGEMWEEERLIAAVREFEDQSCAAVIAGIVAQVRRFEGDQGPSDDITLLVARRATT